MIQTTLNGAAAWLVPYSPDWSRHVTLRARVVSTRSRSLTGREYREPIGTSLRLTMQWVAVLGRAELNQLRGALEQYGDEPVIAPCWPLAQPGDAELLVPGGVTVGWNTDGNPSPILSPEGDRDMHAAALVGRLRVDMPALLTTDHATVEFTLTEDSTADLALTPESFDWADGPTLADNEQPPVFPFRVDWAENPRLGLPYVEITRRGIGDAPRVRASAFYPQAPRMAAEGRVTVSDLYGVSMLLSWWRAMGASTRAHYIDTQAAVASIATPAQAGGDEIELDDVSQIGTHRFLALSASDAWQIVRVSSIDGNTLTLTDELDFDVDESTRVSLAALARHTGDDIELEFEAVGACRTRLAWQELPDEYAIQIGETRGETIGAGVVRAWLYEFAVDGETYRYTSHERNVIDDTDEYAAAPISHGELSESIRLDRDELVIECRVLPWCELFLPGRLSARVLVTLRECEVDDEGTASNVAPRWTGEVVRCSFDGPFVRAVARGPYDVFTRPIPRITMQPGCNHALFDSLCGLSIADWTFTALHVSDLGRVVTLGTWARTGGLPADFGTENYFALGFIRKADGKTFSVLSSTPINSGQISLTLDRTPTWSLGESVEVVPGCDLRAETCHAKFANFAKFGGFPFTPASNPAFTPLRRTQSSYGKK